MIQRILSIALLLFYLVSCEEEPDIREYPIIRTLNPVDIDATGATFRGELVQEGKNKETSFGFTWSMQDPTIKTSEYKVIGKELPEGNFETRINFSLAKGFEYTIRTFATNSEQTVYGNAVTFVSEGTEELLWSKEPSGITLKDGGTPYAWSDGDYGYVLFQNTKVFKYDPETKLFSSMVDFPESGNSGTMFTSVGADKVQYVFSDIDKNLYQLAEGIWSVKAITPFNYGYFRGYYHGYLSLNQIFLLSSTQSFSYDPETNLWQTRSRMPAVNFSIGGTDLNGYAYVMDCGKNINQYDPQEDSWQYITTFPESFPESSVFLNLCFGKMVGFSHNNRIFFGFFYDNGSAELEESIWGFNLTTNLWEEVQPFPVDLDPGRVFYFCLKDKLYIGHGNSGNYSVYSLNLAKL